MVLLLFVLPFPPFPDPVESFDPTSSLEVTSSLLALFVELGENGSAQESEHEEIRAVTSTVNANHTLYCLTGSMIGGIRKQTNIILVPSHNKITTYALGRNS